MAMTIARAWLGLGMTMCVGLATAHAEVPRPSPMARADGKVCDLLRAQAKDGCKTVAQDGRATVYQSGGKASGIHRLVLAIDTGAGVLVGPAVDMIADQLASTRPTLRQDLIDGQPGVVLDVVATWKPGAPAARTASRVSCAPVGGLWKCARVELEPTE